MWGVGDAIFHIAILNELAKRQPDTIWVKAYYPHLYRHIPNIKMILQPSEGRIRFSTYCPTDAVEPVGLSMQHISYDPAAIKKHGSILAAQFASLGMQMPEKPDFRLPIPDEWDRMAQRWMSSWDMKGKPLMIVRPIILNKSWEAPARAPDPNAYHQLYEAIREKYFTVSFGRVIDNPPRNKWVEREWIVLPEPKVDVRLVKGELDFETLAALFKRARLVFGNAGFTPVLAQAVGTPNIVVYGGNESYRSVNCVGAHLAPTLPIEPDRPCDCHNRHHSCNKTITIGPALEKVMTFSAEQLAKNHHVPEYYTASEQKPRILIFQTTYVDSDHRERLIRNGMKLHRAINPDCDYLIVDSASPRQEWRQEILDRQGSSVVFNDNVGHLSRGGRDGWGRAFCRGLEEAINGGYNYVVHIEGDSLFKRPVRPIVHDMHSLEYKSVSTPVVGTKRVEQGWVETGLMFFSVRYLKDIDFIKKYDWPHRKASPTPEKVVADILGKDCQLADWKAWRGDKNQITIDNLQVLDLDWVTHCWDNDAVYDKFVELNMAKGTIILDELAKVKINLGCGTNKIKGWINHDQEVDITQRLPYRDGSVDFIFAEHVLEHVDYYKAVNFLRECHRILKPGGMIRLSVPSIENLSKVDPQSDVGKRYVDFVHSRGWAPSKDLRGAMHALLYQHGHQAPWTQSLLMATLFFVGFKDTRVMLPGVSNIPELQGVEGHGRVIGEDFNRLESVIAEGTVDK